MTLGGGRFILYEKKREKIPCVNRISNMRCESYNELESQGNLPSMGCGLLHHCWHRSYNGAVSSLLYVESGKESLSCDSGYDAHTDFTIHQHYPKWQYVTALLALHHCLFGQLVLIRD